MIRPIIQPHVKKLITCLANGGHAGTVEDLVVEAVEAVLRSETERRSKRINNVPPETNLVTEQYDKKGRRRYRSACIDDQPCMVPDKDGFWTPANDPEIANSQ